jgi:hypothetical protein
MYLGGEMVRMDGFASPTWAWPTSLDAARQGRDNLPVGFIGKLELAREGAAQ